MTDKDYSKLMEFANAGAGLVPVSDTAINFMDQAKAGEVFMFLEITDRDLKFHRCYMSMISYIYSKMPSRFQKRIPKGYFYQYLKHVKGQFEIIAKINNVVLIEYDSIAFGKMSQNTFEDFIRHQLPWIYSEVIGKYYTVGKWRYNRIIADVENEYKKFLSKL